jgi:hypothetical protein
MIGSSPDTEWTVAVDGISFNGTTLPTGATRTSERSPWRVIDLVECRCKGRPLCAS